MKAGIIIISEGEGETLSSKGFRLLVATYVALLLVATAPGARGNGARRGAQIDRIRLLTVINPDAQMIAFRTRAVDFLPDFLRYEDIEILDAEGHLVTSAPSYHICYIGFNLRGPYLGDVNLRHALFHAFNQMPARTPMFTPIRSLVPPAQGEWFNPYVLDHPFRPGNVGDLYPAQHSTFGIMAAAGYTYIGAGYGDLNGRWLTIEGADLPPWSLITPQFWEAPDLVGQCRTIVEEWQKCGFGITVLELPFTAYISGLFNPPLGLPNFDLFAHEMRLDRFPTQLYEMCHSSTYMPPPNQSVPSRHIVGLNDPVLDDLVETMLYSLDEEEAVAAAWEAQERLYDPQFPQALPYMMLYSRTSYNAAISHLDGNVNSDGYGSDNAWTWLNWRWNTVDGLRPMTGDSIVYYCNCQNHNIVLNPLSACSIYDWNIIGPTLDSGLHVNPYTHEDVVWQYSEFPTIAQPITETTPNGVYIENGMSVEYHIRDDIYWQDGNKFEADDALFSLNFLKDNEIPQYITTWQNINDTYQIDALTFKVWANTTSPFLTYLWDKAAFLCPPQVWAPFDGLPLAVILAYAPNNDPTDTGPWSYPLTPNGPPTTLFGTGPFILDFVAPGGSYVDLRNWDVAGINLGYFKTTQEIADLLTELFHFCGDVRRDGWVWAEDMQHWGLSFGKYAGQMGYNPDADLTGDNFVDMEDGAIIGVFWGKKKEYTQP